MNLTSPCNIEALECALGKGEERLWTKEHVQALEKDEQTMKKKKRFQRLIKMIVRNKMWANQAASNQNEKEGNNDSFKTGTLTSHKKITK